MKTENNTITPHQLYEIPIEEPSQYSTNENNFQSNDLTIENKKLENSNSATLLYHGNIKESKTEIKEPNKENTNSFNISHKSHIYEIFEKEQDNVNFIKTLLKLKQKTKKKTNYNIQIALYEKEYGSEPISNKGNDNDNFKNQAIYHNIPIAQTFSQKKKNVKKPKSSSLDLHNRFLFDKSRNYNLISHNSNNSPKNYNLQYNNEKNSKNEKKYSLKPKHPRSSKVSSINLTPNSNGKANHIIIDTIKASSPVKIIDIKKIPISERKNKFNSQPKNVKSYQINIQTKKHFKSKRESSVPITIINLFDDNLETKKIDKKNKKNEKILQTLKNSQSQKNSNKSSLIINEKKRANSIANKKEIKYTFTKRTKIKSNTVNPTSFSDTNLRLSNSKNQK